MIATYDAHVLRVLGADGFEARLDLGFGISLVRSVRMARRDVSYSAHGRMSEANHCLVVLIGGKDLVLSSVREDGRQVTADVYLTAPRSTFPQVQVPGLPGRYVDVYEAMRWCESSQYDPARARAMLG